MMRSTFGLMLCTAASMVTAGPVLATTQNGATEDPPRAELELDRPDIASAAVPARTFQCEARRAMNIDPDRVQQESEIIYEGFYTLTIALPAITVPYVAGKGTPRSDIIPDRGYRVVADPNRLFSDFPATGFDRVADYWPKQVQLAQTVMGQAFQFIILDEIAGQPDRRSLFISRAVDAVTVDTGWIFRGQCQIVADPLPPPQMQ